MQIEEQLLWSWSGTHNIAPTVNFYKKNLQIGNTEVWFANEALTMKMIVQPFLDVIIVSVGYSNWNMLFDLLCILKDLSCTIFHHLYFLVKWQMIGPTIYIVRITSLILINYNEYNYWKKIVGCNNFLCWVEQLKRDAWIAVRFKIF